jgi:hypothetical protein
MILTAQNINRTIILNTASMDENQVSDIIDWKEMTVGSISAKWEGNDTIDGSLTVEAANIPEDAWFDEINICGIDSAYIMNDDNSGRGKKKCKMFNLGVLGYRYTRVKYFKGSNTTGTITIMALGKKNG